MHINLSPAEFAAVRLAAMLTGHANAETFARAVILRFVNNLLDSARDRTDNSAPALSVPDGGNPSTSPLRLFRGK